MDYWGDWDIDGSWSHPCGRADGQRAGGLGGASIGADTWINSGHAGRGASHGGSDPTDSGTWSSLPSPRWPLD